MAYYSHNVQYKYLTTGGNFSSMISYVCFASLRHESNLKKVDYFADCDTSITDECLSFFIEFCKRMLPENTFEVERDPEKKNIVIWKLSGCETRDWNRNLFILTLFRYIQEFPEIVVVLYNERKENFEENFSNFQKLHIRWSNRSEKEFEVIKCDNMSGHGLLDDYKWNRYNSQNTTLKSLLDNYETITHERFFKRISGKKYREQCQYYLKNTKLGK